VIRDGAAAPDVLDSGDPQAGADRREIDRYTDPKLGGTSYAHLMKMADQFGIADLVTRKGVHATGRQRRGRQGRGRPSRARDRADERNPCQGRKLLAPLPEPLQLWTVYSAAVRRAAPNGDARAFIAALTAPAMRSRWTAAGWEPAP